MRGQFSAQGMSSKCMLDFTGATGMRHASLQAMFDQTLLNLQFFSLMQAWCTERLPPPEQISGRMVHGHWLRDLCMWDMCGYYFLAGN